MKEALFNCLRNAITSVPFYRNKVHRINYNEFPIICKKDVITCYDSFFSTSDYLTDLVIIWTSGTTGVPIKICWKRTDYQKSYYQLWKMRKEWYSVLPSSRCLSFFTSFIGESFNSNTDICVTKNTLSIRKNSIFSDGFDSFINSVLEFSPEWILAPVSIVLKLADYMQEKSLTFTNLRYIELNGENVEECSIQYLKKVFNVPISNLYGALEFNGVALTCPFGNMHILDNNVYVESVDNNLYISSLTNTLMPLIKYSIGDFGTVVKTKCRCGSNSTTISHLKGRTSDTIQFNGDFISCSCFSRIVSAFNSREIIVNQYQIIVDEKNSRITLLLCTQPKYKQIINIMRYSFLQELIRYINNPRINVDISIDCDGHSLFLCNTKQSDIVFL